MPEVPVRAPFAGYAALSVTSGSRVAAGEQLGVVEAVKLEAALRSPAAGRVRVALGAAGAYVEGGDTLVWVESG